ncbi:MAG: C69 family dipeptidase [Phycisphaerae bacterium]|nr:C69 family dipeptidase [Phycisphaerae bacterium]
MKGPHIKALALLMFCLVGGRAWPCYTVVVGRNASVDGAVLVGHNEQNAGERCVNFRKIPRMQYKAGDVVDLAAGGRLPQVPQTYAFLWSQNVGLSFSDAYMNEWGVAVVSNGCPDRGEDLAQLEAAGQIRDGGIGYMLRRIVVQRARTARQGVEIAGSIIDEVGYSSSRTLVIADAREAWLLSMTRGRQWVAQRVPDDKVVLLPNVYIVNEVDLGDGENFLASDRLVDYAIEKGWWPANRTPFVFSEAYGRPREVLMDPRQRKGHSRVTGRDVPRLPDRRLSFAVAPAKKLAVRDVIRILRNHEDVALCSADTQEGAVFQLRGNMPAAIGCVYWRTWGEPCTSVLTPWYAGASKVPPQCHEAVDVRTQLTLAYHFAQRRPEHAPDEMWAWSAFKGLQDRVNAGDITAAVKNRLFWDSFEAGFFAQQILVEKTAMDVYENDLAAAAMYLMEYCSDIARTVLAEAVRRR